VMYYFDREIKLENYILLVKVIYKLSIFQEKKDRLNILILKKNLKIFIQKVVGRRKDRNQKIIQFITLSTILRGRNKLVGSLSTGKRKLSVMNYNIMIKFYLKKCDKDTFLEVKVFYLWSRDRRKKKNLNILLTLFRQNYLLFVHQ
jgi:hypothetical protein